MQYTHVYLRPDGNYDCYDVEPVVMSAEDIEKMSAAENLKKRKAELLAQKSAIDMELSEIENSLGKEVLADEPATEVPSEAIEESAPTPANETVNETVEPQGVIRRKTW